MKTDKNGCNFAYDSQRLGVLCTLGQFCMCIFSKYNYFFLEIELYYICFMYQNHCTLPWLWMLWRFWLSVSICFYLLLSVLHRGHRYKTTPKTVIFWRLAPILVIFGPKCLRFGGPQHFNTLNVWPAFVLGPYL